MRPTTPNLAGRVDVPTDHAIRELYASVQGLNVEQGKIKKQIKAIPSVDQIRKDLQAGGSSPLNVQGLLGKLSQPQTPIVSTGGGGDPPISPSDALRLDGELLIVNGQLYVYSTTPYPGSWVSVSSSIIVDTHANRIANFPGANFPTGALFFESDRRVLYIIISANWTYLGGVMVTTQSGIPNDLGTHDTNFVVSVTDYNHNLIWGGSSWGFAPGDGGSGYQVLWTTSGPTWNGWHLCDGSTVNYLKPDGTLGSQALPTTANTYFRQ
jgi:hypothetical protein